MVPQVAHVRRRWRDGPAVWTLDVEALPPAPRFAPGQFNMLTAFGVGEVPISVSGDPAHRRGMTHTIRAVGPVTRALVGMRAGDALGLRGPFGTGWPMDEAAGRDVVVMAGGVGLAPLRPALYRLLAERERYGRIVLLYGTRSPADILFREELAAWRRRFDIEIEITVDHAGQEWHGHVGVVTTLLAHATFDAAHSIALVCGPEVMMRFSIVALRDAGVRDSAIYLSMERNMKCAVGLCGHCQFGALFVCSDGPVFRYDLVQDRLALREL